MLVVTFTIATLAALWLLIASYQVSTAMIGRRLGMIVEEVGIGHGPSLVAWRRGNEAWRISLFPIGGYTKFRGRGDTLADLSNHEEPHGSFYAAPRLSQLAVTVVGPFSLMGFSVLLLCIPVLCGGRQLIASSDVPKHAETTRISGLNRGQQPSTMDNQFTLVTETAGYYVSRLITFRPLEGWGGYIAFVNIGGRLGADSAFEWVSLIGLAGVGFGFYNLLPIPLLAGYKFLEICGSAVLGRELFFEKFTMRMYHLGLFLILAHLARMIWLDIDWLRHAFG